MHHEPFGVCAGILPFNWPPIHAGGQAGPGPRRREHLHPQAGGAGAAGGEPDLRDRGRGAPERRGAVRARPRPGGPRGPRLVAHPLVRRVSFTGSTANGTAVARGASATLTPAALELGGKNALVVFDDADMHAAVRAALEGGFFNKGKACTATSRMLVQRGTMYDGFVERLAAGVRRIKVGDGMDPGTHVGPQVSRAQQARLLEFIEVGKQEGARVAAQAELPTDPESKGGFFVPPTLFVDVREDMRVAKEEMFGPIGMLEWSVRAGGMSLGRR